MDNLPDDLRAIPFHTMGCPDDCALCVGANEIERLRSIEAAFNAYNEKQRKITNENYTHSTATCV